MIRGCEIQEMHLGIQIAMHLTVVLKTCPYLKTFCNLEEGSDSATPTTRSKTLVFHLKTTCLFCNLSKHRGGTQLVRILSDDTINKIKTQCKQKNYAEPLRLVAGNISKF